MVITTERTSHTLRPVTALVSVYVGIVAATLLTLVILTALGSGAASTEAWGHAVIVGVFALVLPLRLRAARRGSARALRAVTIIAGVLVLVNVIEALIPGLFPLWMRVEMIGIAILTAAIVVAGLSRLRS